jgi:DNA (cytosine-5)-methyltransferase 1
MRRSGLRPGDLAVLIGGPPCQGFSESNRRTRTLTNPRNHLYTHFLRFVEAMHPAWVVMENVAGLRTIASGAVLNHILDGLHALGYAADWRELNAAEHGVPQVRRRLFIIANRVGQEIPEVPPTHGDDLLPQRTVRDAISDLPELENGACKDEMPSREVDELTEYQLLMRRRDDRGACMTGNLVTRNAEYIIERYHHIPQGGNWEDIPEELLANYADFTRCHTGIYHRLAWDHPSKVIGNFRKNMLIHPEQHRGLSVREAARLQSFPDEHVFTGSIGFQQQQVADAVPPLLALAVAAEVLRVHRRAHRTPTLPTAPLMISPRSSAIATASSVCPDSRQERIATSAPER